MKQDKTKVLVISGVFPPMPIAEADHIARLSEGLARRGYDVDVLTSSQGNAASVTGCRVHADIPSWNWSAQAPILKAAQTLNPDLVFFWFVGMSFEFHPMISLLPTHIRTVLPNAKIVTQITAPVGVRPKAYPFWTRAALKLSAFRLGGGNISYEYGTLLRDSDRVIAMAESHLERIAEHLPQLHAKADIIPPPPLIPMSAPGDASRCRGRELLGVPMDAPLFAYFGRLYRGKGLEYLIEGFSLLREQTPAARLAIIGGPAPNWFKEGWSVEDLHAISRKFGIEDAISWTGEFPFDSDVGSLYLRAVDYAVLPFDEGAALNNSSIAACAAHDLPVITTTGERPEREFVDGENVLLCAPMDAGALSDAMKRLLADASLTARLKKGAADLTERHFSWKATLDRTKNVFEAALHGAEVRELA
ncbi:glycosyltransferase family 4 protein [Hyphomonas sp.]|uniref:glycosyltransferase family 4 protein n=1 Tax=Hyphomonas sp. TaxID=87 RepID=UPI003568FBD3